MKRRLFGALIGALALSAALPAASYADSVYPSMPIHLIVPYAAGGASDVLSRMVAQQLTLKLGQSVIVDNISGASGIVGTSQGARSKPDGYTILIGSNSTMVVNEFTFSKLPYKPRTDLEPIVKLAEIPNAVMVRPETGFKTVADLVTAMKAKPGQFKYGSPGIGTSAHISGELFDLAAGAKGVHVPYRGSGPMITDLLGGHIDFTIDQLSGGIEDIKAGKLVALAVTSAKRSPLLPNVPTMEEAGFNGYETAAWFGLSAPKGTPRPVIDKLNATVNVILKDPAFVSKLEALSMEPAGGSPGDFKNFMASEYKTTQDLSKTIKLQID